MGDSWEMIPPVEGGWRESHWFGAFLLMDNDWMYHAELGWIYTQSDHFGGHWIWLESHGWLWTQEHTWPYLYSMQQQAGYITSKVWTACLFSLTTNKTITNICRTNQS